MPLTPTAELSRQTGKRVVVVWPSPSGRFVAFKYITRQWPSERGGELMVSHGMGVRDAARGESIADFAAGWDFVQDEGQWDGETFTIGSAGGITLKIHADQRRVEQVPVLP